MFEPQRLFRSKIFHFITASWAFSGSSGHADSYYCQPDEQNYAVIHLATLGETLPFSGFFQVNEIEYYTALTAQNPATESHIEIIESLSNSVYQTPEPGSCTDELGFPATSLPFSRQLDSEIVEQRNCLFLRTKFANCQSNGFSEVPNKRPSFTSGRSVTFCFDFLTRSMEPERRHWDAEFEMERDGPSMRVEVARLEFRNSVNIGRKEGPFEFQFNRQDGQFSINPDGEYMARSKSSKKSFDMSLECYRYTDAWIQTE